MKERKITKAVITCGGYATRFLPICKAVPKEMLPVVDKPIIHYILQELIDAGITDVQLQIGRGREVLMNYLDVNFELDENLRKGGKEIQTNFFKDLNISYRRVPMPRGFADAVWHAKQFVGEDHFVLCTCDDLFLEGNPTTELINEYKKSGTALLTVGEVPWEKTHLYGVIKPSTANTKGNVIKCDGIVEKPKVNPPSNLCAIGRWLLGPEFFAYCEEDMAKNLPGEVDLTKQLNKMAEKGKLAAYKTKGMRFDIGSAKGFVDANVYSLNKNFPQ